MEKLTEERDQRIAAENREKEQNKRLQRQLRDTKEEMGELARKEAEASRKKHELVKTLPWVLSPQNREAIVYRDSKGGSQIKQTGKGVLRAEWGSTLQSFC